MLHFQGKEKGFRLLPPRPFLIHSEKGRLLLLCWEQGHHTDTRFPKGNARVRRRGGWKRDEGRTYFQFSKNFQKWQDYFPEKENTGGSKVNGQLKCPI